MARHHNDADRQDEIQISHDLSAAPTLRAESERLDRLGIAAGIVSLEFRWSEDPARELRRTKRLLSFHLGSTDLYLSGGSTSAVLLRTPVESLSSLMLWTYDLNDRLRSAGLDAYVGFAHRRPGESLLDTWARADAAADRAHARTVGYDGLDDESEWAVRPIA